MRKIERDIVIAVFCASGPQKLIAYRFGVSLGFVSGVKARHRHRDITDTIVFNGALATLACIGAA